MDLVDFGPAYIVGIATGLLAKKDKAKFFQAGLYLFGGYLGYELSKIDQDFTLLPILLNAHLDAKGDVNLSFLGGYFRVLFEKNKQEWEKQLEWFDENVPFEVAEQVSNLIDDVISLQTPHNYLESSIWDLVLSSSGKEKLKRDWPEIWDEFGLDEVSG